MKNEYIKTYKDLIVWEKAMNYEKVDKLLDEVMRMLNSLTNTLCNTSTTTYHLPPTSYNLIPPNTHKLRIAFQFF